ncbi:MAG: hypothetical protein NWQ55_05760 [Salibacteraceae bacterium]|nr:hypothetical protein [Salibacteraceae bacterium]
MKLNVFFILFAFVISIAISSCKTCNECRVARATTADDSLVLDTVKPYSDICGSNRDLRAFEDRCNIEFSSDSGDVTTYICICSEVQ